MKNIRIYYLQLCALIVDNGSVEAITIVVADMRPSQTEMSIIVLERNRTERNGAKPSQEPNRTQPNRIELQRATETQTGIKQKQSQRIIAHHHHRCRCR